MKSGTCAKKWRVVQDREESAPEVRCSYALINFSFNAGSVGCMWEEVVANLADATC